jgi:hypothetical protein
MTINTGATAIRLTACLFMLTTTTLVTDGARGAESLGTTVWDVGRIPAQAAETTRAYLGVYGDVQVRASGVVTSRDQTNPKKSILIDVRRLPPADRQRLRRECAREACSEITMGTIIHGVLQAQSSEPFRSANSLTPICGLCGPGVLEDGGHK